VGGNPQTNLCLLFTEKPTNIFHTKNQPLNMVPVFVMVGEGWIIEANVLFCNKKYENIFLCHATYLHA